MKLQVKLTPIQQRIINKKMNEAKFSRLLQGVLNMKKLDAGTRAKMIVDLKNKMKIGNINEYFFN